MTSGRDQGIDLPGSTASPALSDLCELTAQLAGAPSAVLSLIDGDEERQIAAFGWDAATCAGQDSMAFVTAASGSDVALTDARLDPRFASLGWVDGRLGAVRYYLAARLMATSGQAIGTLCALDTTAHPIPDGAERALTMLARQSLDTLELQGRLGQLERSAADSGASDDQLASFARRLGHDLKTPLTAILGFAELLGDVPAVSNDRSASAYLERCASSGRRMSSMIDRLQTYARSGAPLTVRTVSLGAAMSAVLDELGSAADGADIQWSDGALLADPVQFGVLLENLVANSLMYRSADVASRIRVEVRGDPAEHHVDLLVADNGPGIAADLRVQALTPLVRLPRAVAGTGVHPGLGLAVCARIAAAHGGSLALSDTAGGGTTVTVSFPGSVQPAGPGDEHPDPLH